MRWQGWNCFLEIAEITEVGSGFHINYRGGWLGCGIFSPEWDRWSSARVVGSGHNKPKGCCVFVQVFLFREFKWV